MKNNIVKTEMIVKETKVGVMRIGNTNYISLTDLAKYQNSSDPSFTVKNWLRRVTTIDYVGLTEYGRNSFAMSPTQQIKRTNAIGIISKGGKYSIGTYAHPDIAFEFASWLSPEFKLYLITEFERLKSNEAYQEKIDWQANRLLSKLNYIVHTDSIKTNIVPELTDSQKQQYFRYKFRYKEENTIYYLNRKMIKFRKNQDN